MIDFKSGDPESDAAEKLDEEEMRLQVSLYGLAAKHELEFAPEQGLVRYLDPEPGETGELQIALSDEALDSARKTVVATARDIRDRKFHRGPISKPRDPKAKSRCDTCDFVIFCGQKEAAKSRGRR